MSNLIKRSASERLIIAKTLIESVLDKLPVEPRKGEWLDACGGMKCSCCGFECDDPYYLGEANYCPD